MPRILPSFAHNSATFRKGLIDLLCVLLIPVIAIAVMFCIWAVLFLIPVILLTLPVGIPMWILTAFFSEREPGRNA
jgi:hypothetical protein